MSIRNDSSKTKNSVWIGLVGLRPKDGNPHLKKANGAYTNVLAFVANEAHYRKDVTAALKDSGFSVFEIEDVEPFSERAKRFQIDNKLMKLSQECEKKKIICVGMFYPFLQKGATATSGSASETTCNLRNGLFCSRRTAGALGGAGIRPLGPVVPDAPGHALSPVFLLAACDPGGWRGGRPASRAAVLQGRRAVKPCFPSPPGVAAVLRREFRLHHAPGPLFKAAVLVAVSGVPESATHTALRELRAGHSHPLTGDGDNLLLNLFSIGVFEESAFAVDG